MSDLHTGCKRAMLRTAAILTESRRPHVPVHYQTSGFRIELANPVRRGFLLPRGSLDMKNSFQCRRLLGYRLPARFVLVAISLLLSASTAFTQPQASDFQYLGAFAIAGEPSVDPDPYAYGQRCLALDPVDAGWWITGHDYKAQVFKVEIPTRSNPSRQFSSPHKIS